MSYLKFPPPQHLSSYVEGIWLQESDVPGHGCPTQVLPVGKIDFLFNYGDPFIQLHDGREVPLPAAHIVGQRTRSVRVSATGKTGLLIVSFYPWGAAPFLGPCAREFTDQLVDMKSVFKPGLVSATLEKIAGASQTASRILAVLDFLAALRAERHADALAREAACRVNQAAGQLTIEALARSLHISRRQLTRRFQQTVGLGPKTFARVIRFQKAIGCLRSRNDWTRTLHLSGCYDQAHLIKEFHAFSGHSPESLSAQMAPTPLMRRFNGNELSHFYNTIYL